MNSYVCDLSFLEIIPDFQVKPSTKDMAMRAWCSWYDRRLYSRHRLVEYAYAFFPYLDEQPFFDINGKTVDEIYDHFMYATELYVSELSTSETIK